MSQQWNSFAETPVANRQARYAPNNGQHPPNGQMNPHMSPQMDQGAYTPASMVNRAPTLPIMSPSSAHAQGGGYRGDRDGDIAMEDADQYRPKQAPAGHGHSRQQSAHLLPTEESAAARRYSPMNLSPTANYNMTPQQSIQGTYTGYTPASQSRGSPTRSQTFASPSQAYYASPPSTRPNAPQLPPLQSTLGSPGYLPQSAPLQLPSFNREQKSPRHPQPHQPQGGDRGPVPRFAKCMDTAELRPRINAQPPFRRANPEGGFLSPLQALTTQLPATYRICNPGFKYESSRNPRRVLTKPSKGVKNDGYDNEDSDYILYVNDILGSEEAGHKNRYLILDVLGQGTFGQVVKCQNLKTQEVVAVKVVKNRTAYFNQSMMEVSVLDLLNKQMDKNDDHHLLRLKDTFIHRQHLCLVFELLSVNLYELIKQNQFRGLSTTLVRVFAQQLLTGLACLGKAKLIHCDLKPENILLKNLESPIIKIIDFGSACDERQTVYTYIQSRFYRSPEVLLSLPYSAAIDMWSLGCIVVELFLGLPLFPGSSEYNQVARIHEMLGLAPTWMLEMGKQSGEFFEKTTDEFGRRTFRLKSMEQYSREHNTKEQPSKKYFSATTLPEIVNNYPMPRKNMKPAEIEREMQNRKAFIDFAQGLLNLNPLERWTPAQAKLHPFITQAKFNGPFVPPMTLRPSNSKSPAPGVQEQQRAEAMSKQRQAAQQQQQQQVAAQQQAQNAAYIQQMANYAPNPLAAQQPSPGMYNMYSPGGAPPPYPQQQLQQQAPGYVQQPIPQINLLPQHHHPQQQQQQRYQPQQNPYAHPAQHPQPPLSASSASASSSRTNSQRQRASTLEQHQSGTGIPPALQRVMGHLDPTQPIRLQPSPAYYPPPPDGVDGGGGGGNRRRGSRAGNQGQGGAGQQAGGRGGNNRDFIRNLEDRTLEEGFLGGQGGQGGGHW